MLPEISVTHAKKERSSWKVVTPEAVSHVSALVIHLIVEATVAHLIR